MNNEAFSLLKTENENIIIFHNDISILEEKIILYAIFQYKNNSIKNTENVLTVSIPVNNIITFLDLSEENIYDQIESCAYNLTTRRIKIGSQKENKFIYLVPVSNTHYDNGILTISFYDQMQPFLEDILNSDAICHLFHKCFNHLSDLNLTQLKELLIVYNYDIYKLIFVYAYYTRKSVPKDLFEKLMYEIS